MAGKDDALSGLDELTASDLASQFTGYNITSAAARMMTDEESYKVFGSSRHLLLHVRVVPIQPLLIPKDIVFLAQGYETSLHISSSDQLAWMSGPQ